VHVTVTPRFPGSVQIFDGSAYGAAVARPVECRVDADRRVHCLIDWDDGSAPATRLPATCDFVVVASPVTPVAP
jgi:hypothetical protein